MYGSKPGGLPPQSALMTGRACFREAYAVIPKGVLRDIVISFLPHWHKTHAWVLARPLSGYAETFSWYLMVVEAGGGSDQPEPEKTTEGVLFVEEGTILTEIGGVFHNLCAGDYVYIAPGEVWNLKNQGPLPARFHWIRKRYAAVAGIAKPKSFSCSEQSLDPFPMPDCDGRWATTRFVDPTDLSHDMHVNIVTLQPGGTIPFEETHVMEHGIYILQGKAVYKLNTDWVEVEAGDFLWLRAFCPQACYAGGDTPFRYLIYKDVNRHATLPASL